MGRRVEVVMNLVKFKDSDRSDVYIDIFRIESMIDIKAHNNYSISTRIITHSGDSHYVVETVEEILKILENK
jgi:hypothetical protein